MMTKKNLKKEGRALKKSVEKQFNLQKERKIG